MKNQARHFSRLRRAEMRTAYIFILPMFAGLLLFSVIPLVMAFGLSFFDVPITMNTAEFIGWDNFVEAFHDQVLNQFES